MHLRRFAAGLGEGFTSQNLRRAFLGTLGFIVFLHPFGLVFVAGGVLPDRFAWTASVIIALNGIVVLLSELRAVPPRRALGVFAVLVAALFLVEYVGSQTGVPFGSYAYTETLGLTIVGVPPVIAIAWYGTVIAGWRIAQAAVGGSRPGAAAFLAGLLAVGLDVVLEPVAATVERYWLWEGGTVPLQNYLSWFVFAALAALVVRRITPGVPPPGSVKTAVLVLSMQWSLFVLTGLVHGEILPVLASAGIIVLAAVLARIHRATQEAAA